MNSIESNFVPYQIALDMKSIGFDEPCFGCYGHQNDLWCENPVNSKLDIPEDNILAPLYQQAFDFFREKYKINSEIFYGFWNHPGYSFSTTIKLDGKVVSEKWWGTYEEAELECVKKLIEICGTQEK